VVEKDVKKGFQFLLNYIYDYVSLPKVREDSTFNRPKHLLPVGGH